MKLTIIEKAKNFDEALSRAKGFYERFPEQRVFLEKIFPDLKESNDERIRTFLHHTFTAQYLCKDKLGKWHGEPVANILAWLEKQSTWKPSDEQIKVCKEVYADILSAKGFDLGTVNSELNRLEEELKKLREE